MLRSTSTQAPSLPRNRIGPPCCSVVNVPSGFTHVDDVADRPDSASTRDPCARAATRADNKSGRISTLAAFAALTGAAAWATCKGATATSPTAAINTAETPTATGRTAPLRARATRKDDEAADNEFTRAPCSNRPAPPAGDQSGTYTKLALIRHPFTTTPWPGRNGAPRRLR